MMIAILIVVIVLVAWALHLMQEAVDHREFSLMLAGMLVASAAAAMVGVYFLMGHYIGYVTHMARSPGFVEQSQVDMSWVVQADHLPKPQISAKSMGMLGSGDT